MRRGALAQLEEAGLDRLVLDLSRPGYDLFPLYRDLGAATGLWRRTRRRRL